MVKLVLMIIVSSFVLSCNDISSNSSEIKDKPTLGCGDWGGFATVTLNTISDIPENFLLTSYGNDYEVYNSCDTERPSDPSVELLEPKSLRLSSGGFGGHTLRTEYTLYDMTDCESEPVEIANFTDNSFTTTSSEDNCWHTSEGTFFEDSD